MPARRPASLVGFLGFAIALTVGSYAWACIQVGSYTGLMWLCPSGVTNCSFPLRINSPSGGQSYYSMASSLSANATYDVRYVAGAHTPDTDTACANGTIFAGGASLRTGSTGSWSGKGPLVMPAATGQYTMCALAPVNPTNYFDPKMSLISVV